MTNKELLKIAMPFISLSGKQWNALVNHVDELEDKDSEIYKTMRLLMINQARIEVIADHEFYYPSNDKLRNVNINL